MRRFITALALLSAVAAGCSLDAKKGSADTSASKGTFGINFVVTVNVPLGGVVTAVRASASGSNVIACGASSAEVTSTTSPPRYDYAHYDGAALCAPATVAWADSVTLTAAPQGSNAFIGWAGDCSGSHTTCSLTSTGGDKYVVALFGPPGSAHGNYLADLGQHVDDFITGTLRCAKCHGAYGVGQGIAPACAACHDGRHAPAGIPWPQDGASRGSGDHTLEGHGALWNGGTVQCSRCHGSDLSGGLAGVSCTQCHSAPHTPSTDYADPALHGPAYAADPGSCQSCHGTTFQGQGDVPSCTQCHGKPHDPSEDFADPTIHGPAYAADADACRTCHGELLHDGPSPTAPACYDCHGTPHDQTGAFADPAVHGPEAINNFGGSGCTSCHGEDLAGAAPPLTATACTSCHAAPHDPSSAFADPGAHGPAYDADAASCRTCHGATLAACTRCHGAPHDPTSAYANPAVHGPAYAADAASCRTCHGTDLSGSTSGPSCAQCHGAPHDPTAAFGAAAAHSPAYVAGPTSCATCHGATLAGSGSANSCAECHAAPHDTTAAFAAAAVHGPAFLADRARCASCHGADLAGGTSGVSCSRCHTAMHDLSAAYAAAMVHGPAYVANQARCKTCHGNDLAGGSSGVSCAQCHAAPHDTTAAYATATVHGPAYVANAARCRTCHGTDLTGGISGVSCAQCHGAPHDPTAAFAAGSVHGPAYVTTGAARCMSCHGSQLTGGSAGVSCTQCHAAPPLNGHYLRSHDATACNRCHSLSGFGGYVGVVPGSPEISLSGSFSAHLPGSPFSYDAGNGCTACHLPKTEPAGTGLTQVLFPGSAGPVTTDNVSALCSQCHQATSPSDGAGLAIIRMVNGALPAASRGVSMEVLSASPGTTTTVFAGLATSLVGYTVVFTGDHTDALNGAKVTVTSQAGMVITFAPAIAAPPTWSDTFYVYPTATGGTTTSLVDANRAWSTAGSGQWAGFSVLFLTGGNAGKYRQITASDATSLSFAPPLPGAVASGDRYAIVPESQASIVDAPVGSFVFPYSHPLAAGSIAFGSEGAAMYQYASDGTGEAIYSGRASVTRCSTCHDPHGLGHAGYVDAAGEQARTALLTADLLMAIRAYALNMPASSVPASGKYFCIDRYGTFFSDSTSACTSTSYNSAYTPRLARAAYNYWIITRNPGAYAHNPKYVQQVLRDAIVDLNTGMTAAGVPSDKLVAPSIARPAP
jgi:hypothetical protein